MRGHFFFYVVCTLLLGNWASVAHAGMISAVDKNTWTVGFTGSGWTAGETINVCQTAAAGGLLLGTITADAAGNVKQSWANQFSGAAAIHARDALVFKGVTSGMTTVSGVNSGSFFASWTAPPGNNIGPLGNSIFATGLSGAGIQTGFNVTLIGISANATIVSESTAYDRTLDTLRTSGFYTLTDPGSTFGTYRVTAEFTSLFNPDGNQLTGIQTLDATAQIGTVTPAPTSFILLTSGLLSFAGLHCRRVWLRTQVVAKV